MVRRCLGCMTEYESKYGICPCCGYEPNTSAESPLHIQPGTQLTDRYLVGKVLGFGGFGVTYLAWDSVLNQRVAIKEYLPSEFATRMAGESKVSVFGGNKAEQFADGLIKFVDEARRLAKFQNEDGIVRVLDSFENNNTAYIVMEYLEGETLTAYLEREGMVPLEKAMDWLEPVVRSLETVHQAGIIHRDIAPDNIFLTTDGRIKLIDFGAARYATTSHSRSLTIIIKPGYSPEEQYRSRGEQGPHTDVYALAAVLYRLITGVTPPDALERKAVLENKKKDILEPPSKYCKMDSSLENAILNAMNVQAEDRTETVLAFWNELTSAEPVKRRGNKVKALDLARWPLGLKIALPAAGVFAVTLLFLLLSGRLGFVNSPVGDIMLGEGMTRVPSVINYSIGAAQEMLDNQQLTPLISGRQQSDVIPADLVLTQSISAGQVVEENTQVKLYISAPAETQTETGHAPYVMYFTEEEALAQFRKQGIEPKVEYEYSDDVAAGLVIGQSVMGGDTLEENDDVTLIVSLGPDPAVSEDEGPADGTVALKINRSALSLYIGDTVTLSASGGSGTYQWSSSAPDVVTVRNGAVTAVNQGQAVITVTSGNERAACPVTVREYSLTMSQTQLSLSKGSSITLSVSGAPSGVAVSWSSSNTSVATVQNGLVTAVGIGDATVTAKMTYGGQTYTDTCAVTVTASPEGSLGINPKSLELAVGEAWQLIYSFSPADEDIVVTWSSSNTSVATVSGGMVTAKAKGTATITASMTYNGRTYTDTCTVTVREVEQFSFSLSERSKTIDTNYWGFTLSATPSIGIESIYWSISNTSVVKFAETENSNPIVESGVNGVTNSTAVFTPVSVGTTTITASTTYNGKTYTASCKVTVIPWEEPFSISISESSKAINLSNELFQLSATTSSAVDDIQWSVDNTSVVETYPYLVDIGKIKSSTANFMPVGVGTATITASTTYNGKTYIASCTVTVLGSSAVVRPGPDMGWSITGPTPSVEPGAEWVDIFD